MGTVGRAASDQGSLLHTRPNSSSRLRGQPAGRRGAGVPGTRRSPAALNPRRPARAEVGQAGLEEGWGAEGPGAEGRARCSRSSGFPRSHILFSQPGESERVPVCSRGPPSWREGMCRPHGRGLRIRVPRNHTVPCRGGRDPMSLRAPQRHRLCRGLSLFDVDGGRKAGAGVTVGGRPKEALVPPV